MKLFFLLLSMKALAYESVSNEYGLRQAVRVTNNVQGFVQAGSQIQVSWEADVAIAGTSVKIELYQPNKNPILLVNSWSEVGEKTENIIIPSLAPGSYRILITSNWLIANPNPTIEKSFITSEPLVVVPYLKPQNSSCTMTIGGQSKTIASNSVFTGDENFGDRFSCFHGWVLHHSQDSDWYNNFGKSWSVPVNTCDNFGGYFAYPNFVNSDDSGLSSWNGGWLPGNSEGHTCGVGKRCHRGLCKEELERVKVIEEDTSLIKNSSSDQLHYFYDGPGSSGIHLMNSTNKGASWARSGSPFPIQGYDPSATTLPNGSLVLSYAYVNCSFTNGAYQTKVLKSTNPNNNTWIETENAASLSGNGLCAHNSFVTHADSNKINESVLNGCVCANAGEWDEELCRVSKPHRLKKCYAKKMNWNLRDVSTDIIPSRYRFAKEGSRDDQKLFSLSNGNLLMLSLNLVNACNQKGITSFGFPFEPRFRRAGSYLIQYEDYCSTTGELPGLGPYYAPNRGIYTARSYDQAQTWSEKGVHNNTDSVKRFDNNIYFNSFANFPNFTEGGIVSDLIQDSSSPGKLYLGMASRIKSTYSPHGGDWRHSAVVVSSSDFGSSWNFNSSLEILPDSKFSAPSFFSHQNTLYAITAQQQKHQHETDTPLDTKLMRHTQNIFLYKKTSSGWRKERKLLSNIPVCPSQVNEGCRGTNIYPIKFSDGSIFLFYTAYDAFGDFKLRRTNVTSLIY